LLATTETGMDDIVLHRLNPVLQKRVCALRIGFKSQKQFLKG